MMTWPHAPGPASENLQGRKPRWGNARLRARRYGDLIAADDAPERGRADATLCVPKTPSGLIR